MPKLRTKKAARKRFKVTASGRFKRGKAFHRHIMTSKTRKRKRRLRQSGMVHWTQEKALRRLLPYG
ncbi:MAG: 50S ribosomal protein L35 [Deltaproteobacteria bacterium]|nr:50S ribosomal protein L35 [Deltaproteobacteria bacterium]